MHRQCVPHPTRLRLAAALAASVCLLIPAALSAARESGVKFDREADFSAYETYGWSAGPQRPEGSPMAEGGSCNRIVLILGSRSVPAERAWADACCPARIAPPRK